MLRATQYIPDIVRLQKQLFERFHLRVDVKKARDQTMQEFIEARRGRQRIELRFPENVRREYQEMVASVQIAWGLVRDKLKDHGSVFVDS